MPESEFITYKLDIKNAYPDEAVTCEDDGGEGSEGSTAPVLSKVEVKEYWLRCRLYAEDIELETADADLTVALEDVG